MFTISLNKAHSYILHVLDELQNASDTAFLTEGGELDTLKLTSGFLTEAVLKAHKDAPSHLLDGVIGVLGTDYDVEINDGVAKIVMLKTSARLASFKSSDSPVVISDCVAEDSPIGRAQNNKYVRGTYDDPRLIIKRAWQGERKPEYLYYSILDPNATFTLEYIPFPEEDSDEYEVAEKLEYAVLNLLASMVLDALTLSEKANIYRAKYQEYLQTSR